MAKYRNLYQISREEEEVVVASGDGATEVDVTEVIENNDEKTEQIELSEQIESDNASLEDAVEVVNELTTQVDENEAKLENPEQVTEQDVEIATEAFLYTMAKAGYPYGYFKTKRSRLSKESSDAVVEEGGSSSQVVEESSNSEGSSKAVEEKSGGSTQVVEEVATEDEIVEEAQVDLTPSNPDATPAEKLEELNEKIEVSQEGLTELIRSVAGIFSKNIDKAKGDLNGTLVKLDGQIDGLLEKAKSAQDFSVSNPEFVESAMGCFLIGSKGLFNPSMYIKYLTETTKKNYILLIMQDLFFGSSFRNLDEQSMLKNKDKLYAEVESIVKKHAPTDEFSKNILQVILASSSDDNLGALAYVNIKDVAAFGGGADVSSGWFKRFIMGSVAWSPALALNPLQWLWMYFTYVTKMFQIKPVKVDSSYIKCGGSVVKSKQDAIKALNELKAFIKTVPGIINNMEKQYQDVLNDIDKRKDKSSIWLFNDSRSNSLVMNITGKTKHYYYSKFREIELCLKGMVRVLAGGL